MQRNNEHPLVDQYNNLGRWSITPKRIPTKTGSKLETSTKLGYLNYSGCTSGEEIKQRSDDNLNKLKILAYLAAFKFYRQRVNEDINQQEACLACIQQITQEHPSLELTLSELMIFVRNDSYIVQKKIPGYLNATLNQVNDREIINLPTLTNKVLNDCLEKVCNEGSALDNLLERVKEFIDIQVIDTLAENQGEKPRPYFSRNLLLKRVKESIDTQVIDTLAEDQGEEPRPDFSRNL